VINLAAERDRIEAVKARRLAAEAAAATPRPPRCADCGRHDVADGAIRCARCAGIRKVVKKKTLNSWVITGNRNACGTRATRGRRGDNR
jgi:hypothetical protein